MEPLTIILSTVAFIGFAFGLYSFIVTGKQREALLLAKKNLDEQRAKLADSRKSSSSKKSATKKKAVKKESNKAAESATVSGKSSQHSEEIHEIKKELSSSKDELKNLKQKNYDLAQQLDETREELETATRTAGTLSQDVLFDLRQELAEAKANLANKKSGPKKESPALAQGDSAAQEAPVDFKKTMISTPVSSAPRDVAADADASQTSELRAELEELKSSTDEQLRAAKKDLQRSERETQKKLKKAGRTADQQRRRADNNDKAYKITQRQLDVARERIEYLEGLVKKASFATATEQAEVEADPVGVNEVSEVEKEIAAEESERMMEQEQNDPIKEEEVAPVADKVIAGPDKTSEDAPSKEAALEEKIAAKKMVSEGAPVQEDAAAKEAPVQEEVVLEEKIASKKMISEGSPLHEDADAEELVEKEELSEETPAQEGSANEKSAEAGSNDNAQQDLLELSGAAASQDDDEGDDKDDKEEASKDTEEGSTVDDAWADLKS